MKNLVMKATLYLIICVAASFTLFATASAAPTKMASGFYYPTDRTTWTGTSGGSSGDPKQPYNDGSPGGRIYGYLDSAAPSILNAQHVGMDIRTPYNGPIYAICAGTIKSYITSQGSRYYCIIVQHKLADGTTFYAVYGHCRLKSGYSTGKAIAAGENFGYINENVNQHIHFGIKINSDFSRGWGHLAIGVDANGYGWRPPRTWMMSNTPPGGPTTDPGTPPDTGTGTTDTTAPSITLTAPTANVEYNSVKNVTWNVTDSNSGVNTVTLKWDSGTETTVSASGSAQIPIGEHTATIQATDKAGNTATKTSGLCIIRGVVVTVQDGIFSNGFYAQKLDGSGGYRIQYPSTGGLPVAEGDQIFMSGGTLTTVNGEQVLQNGSITRIGTMTPATPISVPVKTLTSGTTRMGALVTVTGTVTYLKSNGEAFYVDDGSNVYDGYHTGIRVVCFGFEDDSYIPLPPLGTKVTVVGIRSSADVLGKIVPAIRLRSQDDVVQY